MLDRNFFAHTNPDSASPFDRIHAAGYTYSTAGENLAFTATTAALTAEDINIAVAGLHENLFVDAGVTGRGHRVNMLNGDFKEVGIGIQDGGYTSNGVVYNAVMVTQNFGTQPGAGAFLLGVVYDDADNNSFYSPGEGVGSVMIQVVNVATNTVQTVYSMDAGGYQIGLDPGTYDITFTTGSGMHFVNDQVMGVNNVKVDWVMA